MQRKIFRFIVFFFIFTHALPFFNLLAFQKKSLLFENGVSFQARVAITSGKATRSSILV